MPMPDIDMMAGMAKQLVLEFWIELQPYHQPPSTHIARLNHRVHADDVECCWVYLSSSV